jgi:hypothetical protein
VALDAAGRQVARMDRQTNGAAARLELTLDAPSKLTGTGEALFLDGQDAALVRAAVTDAAGNVMHLASNNISFRVLSGPGRVQGSHNGDPRNHADNSAPWSIAYHGLVRAVVRVTSSRARDPRERALLSRIDLHGPMASSAGALPEEATDASARADPIVVEASAEGFHPVRISIPVSTDASKAGVMAAAAQAAGQPVDFFGKSKELPTPDVQVLV